MQRVSRDSSFTSSSSATGERQPMRKPRNYALVCFLLCVPELAGPPRNASAWIGTWAAAPQSATARNPQTFRNQSLRLIVHTSAGGSKIRVKISNTYGGQPLVIGSAHIARRTVGARTDPASDRRLTFAGKKSTRVAPRSIVVSDAVELDVPAV